MGIEANSSGVYSLFLLYARAVANGPVGPAMAGPIIEPVIKKIKKLKIKLFNFFPAGSIIEPVIFIFAICLIQIRHKQFRAVSVHPVTDENEVIVNWLFASKETGRIAIAAGFGTTPSETFQTWWWNYKLQEVIKARREARKLWGNIRKAEIATGRQTKRQRKQ